jgi:hypothetical protein
MGRRARENSGANREAGALMRETSGSLQLHQNQRIDVPATPGGSEVGRHEKKCRTF